MSPPDEKSGHFTLNQVFIPSSTSHYANATHPAIRGRIHSPLDNNTLPFFALTESQSHSIDQSDGELKSLQNAHKPTPNTTAQLQLYQSSYSILPSSDQPILEQLLDFHRRCIFPSDYFLKHDIVNLLFSMTEDSVALQYAMGSFSTLIYSTAVPPLQLKTANFYHQKAKEYLKLLKYDKTSLPIVFVFAAIEVSHFRRKC